MLVVRFAHFTLEGGKPKLGQFCCWDLIVMNGCRNPQYFRQLVYSVVVIKGFWHLGLATGTVDDNDGGCRECTTFSNVMVINRNSNVSINCLVCIVVVYAIFSSLHTCMIATSCDGRGLHVPWPSVDSNCLVHRPPSPATSFEQETIAECYFLIGVQAAVSSRQNFVFARSINTGNRVVPIASHLILRGTAHVQFVGNHTDNAASITSWFVCCAARSRPQYT